MHIFRLQEREFEFALSLHHAVLDGWSEASLTTELIQRYEANIRSNPLPVDELHATIRDFIALEQQQLNSIEATKFWQDRLADRSVTPVPLANRTSVKGVHNCRFNVPDQLAVLASRSRIPIKSFLLAAHIKLLQVFSGDSDIVTGVTMNGRPEMKDGDRVIGLFLNVVPFRFLIERQSWINFALAVFNLEQEILPFRRYPAGAMQENAGEPLFGTAFNYTHFHIYDSLSSEQRILDRGGFARTNLPLMVHFVTSPAGDMRAGAVECDAAWISEDNGHRIARLYERIFEAMVGRPEEDHSVVDLRDEFERHQMALWNRTGREYPHESIPARFEEIACQQPNTPALLCESTR